MDALLLTPPVRRFQCPSCLREHHTRDPRVITPMHNCVKQKNIAVPFVETPRDLAHGPKVAQHVIAAREDYVGAERGLRADEDGRVVMAVNTERPDGSNDCHVFAPVAYADMRGMFR